MRFVELKWAEQLLEHTSAGRISVL